MNGFRTTIGATVAATLTATLTVLAPPAAQATPPGALPQAGPVSATRINDIDGDGLVDVVFSGGLGNDVYYLSDRVRVVFGDGKVQTITGKQIGDTPGKDGSTYFGSRVVVADLNRDGYADVVVSDALTQGASKVSVWALWGGPNGVSAKRSSKLASGIANHGGYTQTGRIAFIPLPEPVLAIGTDEHTGGSVRLYPVKANGSLGAYKLLHLASPGITGRPSYGDIWGEQLAASGSLLVIGDAGYRKGGAVWVLNLLPGLAYTATKVSQASPGMPGKSEADDDYGATVSVLGDQVVVGAPRENVGKVEWAGAVNAFRVQILNGVPHAYGGVTFTQNSPGVPGTVTDGNRFGAQVLATRVCNGVPGALVFAAESDRRDEDRTWGLVASLPLATSSDCEPQLLASTVEADREPLSVLRTDPAGTASEQPVLELEDEHSLGVGWPSNRRVIDLDTMWAGVLARPAA